MKFLKNKIKNETHSLRANSRKLGPQRRVLWLGLLYFIQQKRHHHVKALVLHGQWGVQQREDRKKEANQQLRVQGQYPIRGLGHRVPIAQMHLQHGAGHSHRHQSIPTFSNLPHLHLRLLQVTMRDEPGHEGQPRLANMITSQSVKETMQTQSKAVTPTYQEKK